MATVDDIATEFGVPSISLPASRSVFGRGKTNFFQAQALETKSRADLVNSLEVRDKVSTLGQREQTRIDGAAAMRDISQLDPKDANYLEERNEIMARNPNAALDDTASRFLGLQEDVYRAEQGLRDEDRAVDRSQQLRDLRDASFDKRQGKERRLSKKDQFEDDVDTLNDFGQDRMAEHLADGMSEKNALKQAKKDVQNDDQLNEAIASGIFSDEDIYGARDENGVLRKKQDGSVENPGILDDEDRVDHRRLARKLGDHKRRLTQIAAKKVQDKQDRADLKVLMEELDDFRLSGASEAEIAAKAKIVHNRQVALGLATPDPTGNSQPGINPITGQTSVSAQTPVKPIDRFFKPRR